MRASVQPRRPKMYGERDSGHSCGGGRSASFADGNFVADAHREWNDFFFLGLENLAVCVEDKMVLKLAASLMVAAGGRDGELIGGAGVEMDVEIHRDCRCVKRRPQVR
jgi:hypothetical protein